MSIQKDQSRYRRRRRIRAKVSGTAECPRISVFKSNSGLYAQLIDDESGTTLASASSLATKGDIDSVRSFEAGKSIAEQAKKHNITKAVFDRGGYIYTGRVKELARGARDGGLQF